MPNELSMSAVERKLISDFIRGRIEDSGQCFCNKIPKFMKDELQLDWKTMREPDEKLYDWVARVFPEFETKQDPVKADYIVVFKTAEKTPDWKTAAEEFIRRKIAEQGYCFCASLTEWIPNWRSLAQQGESFPNFLERMFPQFSHELYNNAAAIRAPQASSERDLIREMQKFVFRFVYILINAPLTASLRELTGNALLKPETIRAECIRAVGEYILGLRNDFLDDCVGDDPKLAFPMKLESDRPVYCVLVRNAANGAKQYWRVGGFAVPGINDENGWGRWLCTSFGIPSADQENMRTAYDRVQMQLDELSELQPVLPPLLSEMARALEEGTPFPARALEQLQRYDNGWRELCQAAGSAWMDIEVSSLTLPLVRARLDSRSSIVAQLEEAGQLFEKLSADTWAFLLENQLIESDAPGKPAEMDAWRERCTDGADENAVSALRQMLAPYQAVQMLAQPEEIFTEKLGSAAEIVDRHFGTKLRPRVVMERFCYEAEDNPAAFDFLNQIASIERLLDCAENTFVVNGEMVAVTPAAQQEYHTGMQLLQDVLEGRYVCGALHAAYPEPDELERAVILGETEQIEKILQKMEAQGEEEAAFASSIREKMADLPDAGDELSSLTAGIRLAAMLDNRNAQAERSFLLALALGSVEAVHWLSGIYAEEKRLEELRCLYDFAKNNSAVDADTKLAMLDRLLSCGAVDFRTAAQDNLVMMLAPERIEQAQNADAELAEILRGIQLRMTNPFIQYVVFMNDKLRSYVLEQENIAALQADGIEKTSAALMELVRAGAYDHDRSALNTARRVFSFVGAWNGLAEAIMALVPDSADARAFLFCLATESGQKDKMLELLRADTQLQKKHADKYALALFEAGNYAEYLHLDVDKDPVRATLASIRLGEWDGEPFDVSGTAPETLAALTGEMTSSERSMLAEAAQRRGEVDLAYYLSEAPEEALTRSAEEALTTLIRDLPEMPAEEQQAKLRRARLLYGPLYEAHQGEMLELRYQTALAEPDAEKSAESLTGLLESVKEGPTLALLLRLTEESGRGRDLCAFPAFYRTMTRACLNAGLKEEVLRFFHSVRGKGPEFLFHLISLYNRGLEEGFFPAELLDTAEPLVLARLRIDGNLDAACCAYRMEILRGRLPWQRFALQALRARLDELTEESAEWIRGELEKLPESADTREFAIFAEVLRDPSYDVVAYLNFCRAFRVSHEEDEAVLAQVSTRIYVTEGESSAVLHLLYEKIQEPDAWAAALKLPLQDRPVLYARLLFTAAQQCDSSAKEADKSNDLALWKRCADHCAKNKLYELLLTSLLQWARSPQIRDKAVFPWYLVKTLFAAVEAVTRSGFPQEWREHSGEVRQLLTELILIFDKFNSIGDGDSNHNSLRTIIEFAVAANQEDVILDNPSVMASLTGSNRKLCFVLALRLIRSGDTSRAAVAAELLQRLTHFEDGLSYVWILRKLAGMSAEQLTEWGQSLSGRDLIDAILPDGNRVNGSKLRALVMKHLIAETHEIGIGTLLSLNKTGEDCMVFTALFILCKENPRRNIVNIYNALSGICRKYPMDDRRRDITRNFSRPRREILDLLLIVRAVMEKEGMAGSIPAQDAELNGFLRTLHRYGGDGAWAEYNVSDFVNVHVTFYDQILRMYDGMDQAHVTDALLATVTGNWIPFLKTAWPARLQSYDYFALSCGKGAQIQVLGLKRSALQMMKELNKTERRAFVQWLKSCSAPPEGRATENLVRLYAVSNELENVNISSEKMVHRFYDIDVLDERFLTLPMEEHFVCLGDFNDLDSDEMLSCFHWMRRNTSVSKLRTTAYLFLRLAQDNSVGVNITNYAQQLFDQRADEQAAIYFEILNFASHHSNTNYQVFGSFLSTTSETERQRWKEYWREYYQCCYRISGAFSGDKVVIAKLSGVKMKTRSAYNLVITLLMSKRSGEVHRLAGVLTGTNRALALDLLRLVSPKLSDEEKLSIRETYQNNSDASEGITYLLSRTNWNATTYRTPRRSRQQMVGVAHEPLFLLSLATAQRLGREFIAMINRRYVEIQKEVPVYLAPESRISLAALEQLEAAPTDVDSAAEAAPVHRGRRPPVPAFAMSIRGALSTEKLPDKETLKNEYAGLAGSYDRLQERMDLSGQLYVVICNYPNVTQDEVSNALTQYGLDYYSFHYSSFPGARRELAEQAIRELAVWTADRHIDEDLFFQLTERVSLALQRILKEYPSIDALVEDTLQNREGYSAMVSIVTNQCPFLPPMYSILNTMCRACANIAGPKLGNEEQYKLAYRQCIEQMLGLSIDMRYGEWQEVRNKLITLLQEAQNELDQRPDLSVKVLNRRFEGMRSDSVFGELMNTGREGANSIEMFMSWLDGQNVATTPKYTFASLKPGEKAAFALEYELRSEATEVEFTITVRATGHGTVLNVPAEKVRLKIVEAPEADFDTELYNSSSPVEFTEVDGEIVSPGFFGRESQQEELRRCVTGEGFADYKNRVVQGVRRSGKTSLLNYLRKYCAVNRPGLVVVFKDCQGVSHQHIQTVFIKSVLDAITAGQEELRDLPVWSEFCETWSLTRDDADRLQQDLVDFYTGLNAVLGRIAQDNGIEKKGVLLIIDEFDVLLQKLGEENADDLLKTLRSVMSECREIVKFVFCGSNNLILYKMNGGRYNQFFHSVEVIGVDDLPPNDLENMLRAPYKETDVEIPDKTMEWVYRYTGGLVWYTKLLGKAMLERAKAAGRTVVYPTDVYDAFTSICTDSNCQQFYEGCGDDEHLVLQTLARLSPRYRSVVSKESLRTALGGGLSESKLTSALNRLTELRLIEGKAERYSFRKEIYRRYFRSKLAISDGSVGDIMEKTVSVTSGAPFGGFARKR